jgi:soluble lytic murein transglycosylase-like protein
MDVAFARSRRAAESRREVARREPKKRRPLRVFAIAGCVALLFAAGAGLDRAAEAQRPAHAHAAVPGAGCGIPTDLRPAFARAASETGLPLALLSAVGSTESQMQQNARSKKGAAGVMQLMPATARELRLDPTSPDTNVLAGARYLKQMFDRFHSSDLALAAYNAGPTAVARAAGAPGTETLAYVANVTARWRALAGCS